MRFPRGAFLFFVTTSVLGKTCEDAPCAIGQLGQIDGDTAAAATCPTQALSDYANYAKAIALASETIGIAQTENPNQFERHWTGMSAEMLQTMRRNAGVSSIDEALAKCSVPKKGQRVVVVDSPIDNSNMFTVSIEVRPEGGGTPFWIPSSFIERTDK